MSEGILYLRAPISLQTLSVSKSVRELSKHNLDSLFSASARGNPENVFAVMVL